MTAALFSGLSYGQMLPNSGFESWENLQGNTNAYNEPIDWNTANECSELLNIESVTQSSDAYSGSSSAMLETKATTLGVVIINGLLTTATMDCNPFDPGQSGGYAFTQRPDSLVSWIKYAPSDTDNGYIQIIFFNAAGDTIAYEKNDIMSALSNWTRIAIKINWMNADQPALSSVLFNSSWGNGNVGEGFVGSTMYVDDVEWVDGEPEGISDSEANQWRAFPNPVIGELTIDRSASSGGRIEMLDMTGRVVLTQSLTSERTIIDMESFSSGVYLYQLSTIEDEVVRTGKLLVNH